MIAIFIILNMIVPAHAIPIPTGPVSPAHNYVTDMGFRFRAAMEGEWGRSQEGNGTYLFGKKPDIDGSTIQVEVTQGRHQPESAASTSSAGGTTSADGLLKKFQKDMSEEIEKKGLTKVRNDFTRDTFRGAQCLRFDQANEDAEKRTVVSKGMVCIHPSYQSNFIRLAFNQVAPNADAVKDTRSDESALFSSLDFVSPDKQ